MKRVIRAISFRFMQSKRVGQYKANPLSDRGVWKAALRDQCVLRVKQQVQILFSSPFVVFMPISAKPCWSRFAAKVTWLDQQSMYVCIHPLPWISFYLRSVFSLHLARYFRMKSNLNRSLLSVSLGNFLIVYQDSYEVPV